MTSVCAQQTAGVDVERTSRIAPQLGKAVVPAKRYRMGRLAMLIDRARRPRPSRASSRPRRRRGSRRGGGRRSLFGNPGLAQAVENLLSLDQECRVVAHRRPGGAGARDGEGRVEREASLDGGMRLVESTKLREGGAQHKMWLRIISVGLDRPSKPRDRLVPAAELVLR